MGCSNIKPESIYDSIHSKMEFTEENSLDDFFHKAERILHEIEVMRTLFICEWGSLLYNSGAMTLINPTIIHTIYGILYQVSRDMGPNPYEIVEVKMNYPFLFFKEGVILSKSLVSSKMAFESFVKFLYGVDKIIYRLFTEIDYYDKFYKDIYHFSLEEFGKKVNNNPFLIQPFYHKAERNKRKIERGISVILDLREITNIFCESVNKFKKVFKEEFDDITRYKKINDYRMDRIKRKEISDNLVLFSKFTHYKQLQKMQFVEVLSQKLIENRQRCEYYGYSIEKNFQYNHKEISDKFENRKKELKKKKTLLSKKHTLSRELDKKETVHGSDEIIKIQDLKTEVDENSKDLNTDKRLVLKKPLFEEKLNELKEREKEERIRKLKLLQDIKSSGEEKDVLVEDQSIKLNELGIDDKLRNDLMKLSIKEGSPNNRKGSSF